RSRDYRGRIGTGGAGRRRGRGAASTRSDRSIDASRHLGKSGIPTSRRIAARAAGAEARALSGRFHYQANAAIVSIPLLQKARIGAYIVRQQLAGRRRYPLVLMLEPLFRCNLACAGCGKIDYPDEILNQRLSVEQ